MVDKKENSYTRLIFFGHIGHKIVKINPSIYLIVTTPLTKMVTFYI